MAENELKPRSGELKRREQQVKRRMIRLVVFTALLVGVLYAYGVYKSRIQEEEAIASRRHISLYQTQTDHLKKNAVTPQRYKAQRYRARRYKAWQHYKAVQQYKKWQHYKSLQRYKKWQHYQALQRYKAWQQFQSKHNSSTPTAQ